MSECVREGGPDPLGAVALWTTIQYLLINCLCVIMLLAVCSYTQRAAVSLALLFPEPLHVFIFLQNQKCRLFVSDVRRDVVD